jgi:diguanylate cyclase (GGDEF)-like protein
MEALFALFAALFAGVSVWQVARADRRAAQARARASAAEEESERLARRVRALQREVETLSAIREVALIANGDVSFERILTEVLKIVEDLLEASEVAIWIAEEKDAAGVAPSQGPCEAERRTPSCEGTGELRPRALRRSGQARFDGLGDEDRSLVDSAFRERRTLRRLERGEVAIATLLQADAEVAGVLAARVPGGAGRTEEELCAAEQALEAIAKHVALAVRKPTLYDRATVDALTQLYTKRHFLSQLARHCATSRRTRSRFALLLSDIDHFKKINDTHGHLTGDLVLSQVAATIRAGIREYDSAYRYGGEEMAVILPEAGIEDARALAERLRAALEARPFRTAKGETIRVTASFGVAAFSDERATSDALVAAADKALYAAKEGGRNCVRAAGDPPPPAACPKERTGRRRRRIRAK